MNLTSVIPVSEITAGCVDWCKEQYFVHYNNLEIFEMSFIVIALISLIIHNAVENYIDFFREHNVSERYLEMIYEASSLLVFIMLIFFLIYMVWLR